MDSEKRPRKKARIEGGDENLSVDKLLVHIPIARVFGAMDQGSQSARSDPVYQYCYPNLQNSRFVPITEEVEINKSMKDMTIIGKFQDSSNVSVHDGDS